MALKMFKPKKKRYSKSEFRYNYTNKHMNYVFEEDGRKYHSLGITHDNTTYDKKKKQRRTNMPLAKNPERNKLEPSYIRYGIITDKKDNYSKKLSKKFNFSAEDFGNVKAKIRNYKNIRRKR